MEIYKGVRRSLGATLTACCATAAIGAAAMPAAASAAEVECGTGFGSGSSLQASQQTLWNAAKLGECKEPNKTPLKYSATGSGTALEEWGMQGTEAGKKLLPAKSGNGATLDTYIGTDDPPSKAEVEKGKEASGAWPITLPTVQAPVAIIVHAPASCEITSTNFQVPNKVLNELWLNKFTTWAKFLEAAGITFKAGGCTEAMKLVVRSDPSGTTFAFKNYLCQIDGASEEAQEKESCASWKGFLGDQIKWPVETEITKAEKKGSGGMVAEVEAKVGSVGYVNLANAAAKFKKFAAAELLYWTQIQDNGTEAAAKYAEPGTSTKANCPVTLTEHEEKEVEKVTTTSPIEWTRVHVAAAKTKEAGIYSICTATYDIGWETYKTATLEGFYGAGAVANLTNTAALYFKYQTGAAEGQSNLASDYAALPSQTNKPTMIEKARTTAKLVASK